MTGKARSNDELFEAYQLKQNAKFENFLAQNTNIDHGQFFTSAPPQRDLRTFLNKEFGGVMGGVIGYNPSVVTITSGVINIGRDSGKLSSHVIIQAESGTTDTLTDIQNFVFGYQDLTIQADTGDTITVSTGGTTGSDIFLGNNITSVTLNSTEQLQLRYDTIANRWATFIDTTSGGSGVSFPITPTVNILGTVTTAQDIDLSLTTAHSTSMTLGADISITFSNYPTSGTQIEWELEITQDSTGGRVITWPTEITNPPTLSTTADSITVVVFRTNDGGTTVRVANTVTTTGTGDIADWADNDAVADINFATFDGTNIDRLRFVSDSGTPASSSDPSIFLDSSGNMVFNVNTLNSYSFKVLNEDIAKFTEVVTGVVALDMLDHRIKNISDIRFFDTTGVTTFAGTDPAIGYDSTNSRFIINYPTGSQIFIFENQTLGSTILTSNSVSSNTINAGSVLQLGVSAISPTVPGEFRNDGTDVSVFSGGAIVNFSNISETFTWTANHDANTNALLGATLVQYVDTGSVVRGSISGDSTTGLTVSTISGGSLSIQDVITPIATFDNTTGLTMEGTHVINMNTNTISNLSNLEFTSPSPSVPAATVNAIFVQSDSLVHNVPTDGDYDFRENGVNFLVMDKTLASFSSGTFQAVTATVNLGVDATSNVNILGTSTFNADVTLSNNVDITPFSDLGSNLGSTTSAFGNAYINKLTFDITTKFIDSVGALDLEFEVPSGGDMIFQENGTEFWRLDGGDNICVFSRDIEMTSGEAIRANTSGEIGYFVTNTSTSVGNDGSLQIPTNSGSIISAAFTNTDFGGAIGCMGLYLNSGGIPTLVIKITSTTPGTWQGMIFADPPTTFTY